MKLQSLLKDIIVEVGEGSSKPFEYDFLRELDNINSWWIKAENSKGEPINIMLNATTYTENKDDDDGGISAKVFDEIGKDTIKSSEIEFKIEYDTRVPYEKQYIEINDRVYMFRLMSTLKVILLPFVKENNIDIIEYTPAAKKDGTPDSDKGAGRNKLYGLFIKKTFPNAKMVNYNDQIYFILN